MQYIFGAYTLDVQRDELRHAAGVVQLDRQVFAVLAYLVQHHDRVVPRQELFEQLWPERFVTEAALERCITIARRAVGDSGRRQCVIQTVHGRGYRFVAPVEEHHDAPPGIAPPTTPPPDLPEVSPPPLPDAAVSPAAPALPLSASPSPPPPTALRPTRPPLPTGERRQVTVLCSTLAHATALADRLGLEAFRPLVHTFHTLIQECVQRYEGTIQTLGEEGVLALFGVPVAQEEHAWHAVQEQDGLAADTPVPETIQAVLAARIDRLPPEAKHLLHTAAVLGTEVPVPLLEAIAELSEDVLNRSLAHLQAAEFLYETRLVPKRVYTFKHTLTHEVAAGPGPLSCLRQPE